MSDVYNKTRRTTYTNVSYETEQTRDDRDATRDDRPSERTAGRGAHRRSEYATRASRRKQLDVRARQRARAPARAAQA